MKKTLIGFVLVARLGFAQSPPTPELAVEINSRAESVVANGWPMVIQVVVLSADGQPLKLGVSGGAWTHAVHLSITDQNGKAQRWPLEAIGPGSATATLSGYKMARALWTLAVSATTSIPAGQYNVQATLDTTSGAASGAWNGSVQSNLASVTIEAEPSTLTPDDQAAKYFAVSTYARLHGDVQGASSALDALISTQPNALQAYAAKADLLSANGDYKGAISALQTATAKYAAANPNPSEPPALYQRMQADLVDKLAAQQFAKGGPIVNNVLPGLTVEVLTPDSIASGYGADLATSTAQNGGTLDTTLAGTTVTITDSSGAATPAKLFFVSQYQVNYLVPSTVTLGAGSVTVKSGDGTTSTGRISIVPVQPAIITFNTDGLVAGNIVRVVGDQQTSENLFQVDSSGAVTALPVDLSNGQVYLVMYGTGLRNAGSSNVSVTIGGVAAQVLFAGAQGAFVGLDQINVLVPPSLAGAGDAPIVVTASGKQAAVARITVR
jgi:uncharacterized protein (TIGR03437 family)